MYARTPMPDSSAAYTVTQLRDLYAAPVWHPEEHPPLPPIVAHGRKPGVFACGVCVLFVTAYIYLYLSRNDL